MERTRKFIMKFGGFIASFVLLLGVSSASVACLWWFHQPKVPDNIRKLR